MLHVYAAMPTPHDMCYKEPGLLDESPCKGRGRIQSDDLSTAAPSPEASPLLGPQNDSPLYGPEDLLLPDLGSFQLPEAQDSISGSDAEFELAGFDDKDSDLASTHSSDEEKNSDLEEDAESQLLDLLSELASLRAESRQRLQQHKSDASLQKIPYPQLESGFLPAQFMPIAQSWLMPSGRAETGQWAHLMAPRPSNDSMEPLNIVIGMSGVTLEVVASSCPEEWWSECERKRASKAKEVFRRGRGRSRSPLVSMDEMRERRVAEGCPRGRTRHRAHGDLA